MAGWNWLWWNGTGTWQDGTGTWQDGTGCGGMELQCGKVEWELAFCSFHSPIPRFLPGMCQSWEEPGNKARACNVNCVDHSAKKVLQFHWLLTS